ncbi:MAG: hypothetical protein IJ220_05225 [Clostridia bacterium]|nr:hypothetical protein [Clostridia bacterium]
MKKFLVLLFSMLFYLTFFHSYVMGENIVSNSSKEFESNKMILQGDAIEVLNENTYQNKNENYVTSEPQNTNKETSEEGASVDTSITEKNYTVETPTIILLIFFGVLFVIFLILIILKI